MTEPKVSLGRRPRGPIVIQIKGWYPIVMIGIVMMMMTFGNIVYTNHVDARRREAEHKALTAVQQAERVADRRWCTLMGILNNAYNNSATPPTTPVGAAVAKAVNEIYMDLGC